MRRTHLFTAILLIFAVAAPAQVAPRTDWRTPPKAFFIIPPLTAFPDPLSVAAAINPTPNFTAEGGVTLVAPGAFVRAGVAIPFKVSEQDGSALLLMAGFRTVVIPLIHGSSIAGPTASVAVRSWPRAGGWGWQLNVGGWYGLSPRQCDDVPTGCPGEKDARILPEVRIAAIRWR